MGDSFGLDGGCKLGIVLRVGAFELDEDEAGAWRFRVRVETIKSWRSCVANSTDDGVVRTGEIGFCEPSADSYVLLAG